MDTKALRQKVLDLAIRGKLVPQDPNDEPASALLERIRAEKERLIAEGKIKRPKKSKSSSSESHYQKLPDGWIECRIEEIAKTLTDFVASGSFASLRENVQYYDSPNYAILVRTKDFSNNFKNGLVYTDKHGYDFLNNSNLYGGELILPNIGASIGKVFIMPTLEMPMTLAPNSIMIRCWEKPILKWLYILFQSTLGQNILASISASTAQGKFNKTDLREVQIPLPPLEEIRRILGQVDSLLSCVENINNDKTALIEILNSTKSKILELAMQGKLVPQDPSDEPAADMLRLVNPKARIITDNPHYPQLPDNWVLTTIESVCNYGNCTTIPVENIEDDKWVLELEDIEKDSGRVIERKDKIHRKVNGVRHQFNKGDVLYSKLRTYLNKVVLAETDGYCTTEIIPISCNKSICPQYLCHWLRSPYFLNYTLSCGYGVKMPRLSTSDARNGIVPLPPINEQKNIVLIISVLFNTLDNLSNSLS